MKTMLSLLLLLLLSGLWAPQAAALEVNYGPLFTGQRDETGQIQSWQMFGPLLFSESRPTEEVSGLRPLWVGFEERDRPAGSFHFLYPLLNIRHRPYGSSWDLLTVLRFQSFEPEGAEPSRSLHLFPFFFWGQDPDPDLSYLGIFPIVGHARNVLFYERATWFLFPLAARLERGGVTTYAMPWPFIRLVRGPETSGFHLWPLYGQVETENVSRHRYWLWPLGYRVERQLWKEEPFEAFGFLPFYAASRSDRAVSQTFVWPFFGYTASQTPQYHETRYFWPLLVQRRGESYINRWAPIYTRSIRLGQDTRWILWPLHRHSSWEERELLTERTQFLYFLYWSQRQSSLASPELAPAIKQHVWPFYSYWDNGAGRRQFQALSPFEVFLPFNDVVRAKYSPLFAIYRIDVEEDVRARHSFLFNLITTRSEVVDESFQVHIGPLFSYERDSEVRTWEILKGLVSYSRRHEGRSFGLLWWNRPGRDDPEPETEAEPNSEPAPIPSVRTDPRP
jgi:hypothetical protein